MFDKLKSTLSTVTSTLQAVRELPGAMKEAIVFTRESSEVKRELEAANAQIDKDLNLHQEWMEKCIERDRELDLWRSWCRAVTSESVDLDDEQLRLSVLKQVDGIVAHWSNVANGWRSECNQLAANLAVERHVGILQWDWAKERIRSLQSSVSDWRGKHKDISKQLVTANNELQRLGRELNEARQVPEDPECEDYPEGPRTWRRAWKMLKKERGKWQKERSDLRAKLARYEAAEKWHQVTEDEGELPPEGVEVIYKFRTKTQCYIGKPRFYRIGPFEWRFLSSEDVSQ